MLMKLRIEHDRSALRGLARASSLALLLLTLAACTVISALALFGCGDVGGGNTPGFTISLNPTSLSVVPGGQGATQLTITPQNGFTGTVNLALQGAPQGVSLSPTSVTVSGSNPVTQTLTISVASNTPTGSHSLTLKATSGSISKSAPLTLTVSSSPTTKIAFASTRDGSFDIYVMNADGTNPVNLTNNPAADGEPAWSPRWDASFGVSRGEPARSCRAPPPGVPSGGGGSLSDNPPLTGTPELSLVLPADQHAEVQ